MRFFFDTEFTNDDPVRLELISIAFVGDDGSEFYAISDEWSEDACSDWVREHVLPLLEQRDDPAWMSREQIRDRLVSFVGDRATELWAYTPSYDVVLLHALFGGWSKVPTTWPWNCWDLKQWAWHLGASSLPPAPERQHHALVDARHQKDIHAHLLRLAEERSAIVNPQA